jgi:tRNA G18 (ribose-2'-O)-methylase SpoU
MSTIDSIKDPRVAAVRELASRADRRRAGRCVIEGESLIAQAAAAGVAVEYVLHAPRAAAAPADVACYPCTPAVLARALRTSRPVTAVALARLPPEPAGYGEFAVVADRVREPGNLGTIARTALGLGASDLVCTDAETDFFSRKAIEASRCACLRARIHRYAGTLAAVEGLQAAGFQVVASSPHAPVPAADVPLRPAPVALLIGNETDGLDETAMAAADLAVAIPMAGGVESLNVGVATALCMAELMRARGMR